MDVADREQVKHHCPTTQCFTIFSIYHSILIFANAAKRIVHFSVYQPLSYSLVDLVTPRLRHEQEHLGPYHTKPKT